MHSTRGLVLDGAAARIFGADFFGSSLLSSRSSSESLFDLKVIRCGAFLREWLIFVELEVNFARASRFLGGLNQEDDEESGRWLVAVFTTRLPQCVEKWEK